MEIQQHDGVVVEVAGISAGLRQAQREGEVLREGEGGARGCGMAALPLPRISSSILQCLAKPCWNSSTTISTTPSCCWVSPSTSPSPLLDQEGGDVPELYV